MLPADYYLPPPVRCDTLAAICARAGGIIEPLPVAAPARVEYSLPIYASSELRDYFAARASVECPSLVVARIPCGRVFGPGHVLSPDGQWIARDVSLDFGKAPTEHWLLSYQKIRQPQRLTGPCAVIATSLGAGYCHWLLEELPRLLAIARQLPPATTVLAHTRASFVREAISEYLNVVTFTEPARLSHYQSAELIVPSLLGPEGCPTPAVIDTLTTFAAPLLDSPRLSPWGERLYISREKARRRRVVNESALWSALESRGFQRVCLEDLPWPEQITAFRAAKVIVAPHGAGLANLVWCRPGTRVVEFFHRSYVNGLFWQLAALQQLDYRPLVPPGPEPLSQTPASNRENLDADIAAIVAAVTAD